MFLLLSFCGPALAANPSAPGAFPPPLESYHDANLGSVWAILKDRVSKEPFNLWATAIFLAAVVHTFLSHKFTSWSREVEERHRARASSGATGSTVEHTCIPARLLHFLGEVEAIFGIWVIPLFALMAWRVGWTEALSYLDHRVSYNEPLFVVVIMVISSTRPVIRSAEQVMHFFARLGGGGPGAWWLAILTAGPMLGSLITEPAAMTICALLLGRQFYARRPSLPLAYATLGVLFVNISVGGVLTHFAAPPVLMVAGPWHWNTPFMFMHFGWVAAIGIVAANLTYYFAFRKSFKNLAPLNQPLAATAAPPAELPSLGPVLSARETPADLSGSPGGHLPAGAQQASAPERRIPPWVTLGHLLFMAWSVINAHHLVLLVGGFLFFIAFFETTADYQSELQVRSPIMVGFFLAGLVVHGGLQQWWIGPVLGGLSALPMMLGAMALTAFNDNAAVTYLSTLIPGLSEPLKYAVVAGAVTGGGLTVIANAPNPAGQSLLARYFPDGISPLGLFLGALPPTIILALAFLFLG